MTWLAVIGALLIVGLITTRFYKSTTDSSIPVKPKKKNKPKKRKAPSRIEASKAKNEKLVAEDTSPKDEDEVSPVADVPTTSVESVSLRPSEWNRRPLEVESSAFSHLEKVEEKRDQSGSSKPVVLRLVESKPVSRPKVIREPGWDVHETERRSSGSRESSEPMTKKQRENMRKQQRMKEARAEQDRLQEERRRLHERTVMNARMREQDRSNAKDRARPLETDVNKWKIW